MILFDLFVSAVAFAFFALGIDLAIRWRGNAFVYEVVETPVDAGRREQESARLIRGVWYFVGLAFMSLGYMLGNWTGELGERYSAPFALLILFGLLLAGFGVLLAVVRRPQILIPPRYRDPRRPAWPPST